MNVKIALIIALSCIAGLLYHLGGTTGFNTKVRDIGVPVVFLFSTWVLGMLSWVAVFSALLLFASLTTYNKWVGKIFKRQTNDVFIESWAVTGLFYGLSSLPMVMVIPIDLILIRAVLLAFLVAVWSELIGKVFWEECGRGFFIIITLLLFLLW